MKKHFFNSAIRGFVTIIMLSTLLCSFFGCNHDKAVKQTLAEYETPDWFKDAKFGIFIHYGIYSVPAFGDEWYGHWMYMQGDAWGGSNIFDYHRATYGGAAKFGYKDFIPDFNDALRTYKAANTAESWAQLFKNSGAKYVVAVGMHHDSFALYDSDIQATYNSVAQAGVDYIGDLQAACKAQDMKFGISNHFAENDWFFDEAHGAGTDMVDPEYSELYGEGGSKTKQHVKKWYDISMEIIEKYQPDLIYYDFDLDKGAFNKYKNANRYLMLSNYYNMAKEWENCDGVVCNYKHSAFSPSEAVLDKERSVLPEICSDYWQTDTSVGKKAWGYTTDEVYRTGEEFIGALVDIVSKNGNLLLNVGPKADGTMPDEIIECLTTIGDWLNTYGDAIYNTRPWHVYGEGTASADGDNYAYTASDIRFTVSKDGKSLFATPLGKPGSGEVNITTLKAEAFSAADVAGVYLLDGSNRIELSWQQTGDGLVVQIPADRISGAFSMEIRLK